MKPEIQKQIGARLHADLKPPQKRTDDYGATHGEDFAGRAADVAGGELEVRRALDKAFPHREAR